MDDPNIHAYGEGGPDDAEIGRQWRENSSLEKWFPLTAEELERLRADNAALRREAHSWWTAARDALKLREPLAPEAIEAAAAEAFGYEGGLQEVNLGDLLHFARTLEQRHGIGPNARLSGAGTASA